MSLPSGHTRIKQLIETSRLVVSLNPILTLCLAAVSRGANHIEVHGESTNGLWRLRDPQGFYPRMPTLVRVSDGLNKHQPMMEWETESLSVGTISVDQPLLSRLPFSISLFRPNNRGMISVLKFRHLIFVSRCVLYAQLACPGSSV